MIEINYTITDRDDLDSLETNSEYSFNRRFSGWQYFTYFQENQQIFLLHSKKGLSNLIIPKRMLKNLKEIENLRQIFNAKIESKK